MEPTSPALAGQLFTTEPPRKLKNPFTFYKTRSRVSGTVKVIRPPWWGQIGYSAHFRVPEEQGCFQDTGVEGQSQTHCWTFLKTMLAWEFKDQHPTQLQLTCLSKDLIYLGLTFLICKIKGQYRSLQNLFQILLDPNAGYPALCLTIEPKCQTLYVSLTVHSKVSRFHSIPLFFY